MNAIETIKERLAALRAQMQAAGVHAFYVSGTDPHQSEYMPEHWQVRPFITGFTGSAGLVVITMEKAALWTDSRYFLQAATELEGTHIELMKQRVAGTPEPAQWLAQNLQKGDVAGTDFSCLSVNQYRQLKADLALNGLLLKDTGDLTGIIRKERPALPNTKIYEHELPYAGTKRSDKIAGILKFAATNGANATLLTALDDLAWTFNLRGKDVPYNPVFVGFGFISTDLSVLFINPEKIEPDLVDKLHADGVRLMPYNEFYNFLSGLPDKYTVMLDPGKTSQAITAAIPQTIKVVEQTSAAALLKAQKSTYEIIHIRETMRKDGVAMVNFLFWLNENLGKTAITEFDVAEKLEHFRSQQEGFMGNSFFPIVGLNENGAIIHRKVTKESAAEINQEGILLFDSGGQFLGGTTDITRTITLSEPTSRQKADFTLVLKGMIGLSRACFPAGTIGCNLDAFAREHLWKNGLNYGHGTGHGIGYFLNVHEGPMSIRQEYNEHTIKPGMVLSNEPGVYREGAYGIRIENVIVCTEKKESSFGRFLGFETLTLCPIDLNLIEAALLTNEEKDWLNNYHQRVFSELSPLLDEEKVDFLKKLTQTI